MTHSLQAKSQHLQNKSQKTMADGSIRRKAFQNFIRNHGYHANLAQPKTFSEKLLYRKLQQHRWLEQQASLVDKHAVREYIRQTLGEAFLIPQLGYLQDANDFDFERFPPPIILKATHGSGWNLIIRTADEYSLADVRALISAWLGCNYADNFTGEAQYRLVDPGVVVEPLLTDAHGKVPVDYKFHCFDHGKRLIVQTDMDRFGDHSRDFFDEQWQNLDLQLKYNRSEAPASRPDNLPAMLKAARALSQTFDYVRVDLYSFEGKVLFGEITFVPGNACEKLTPAQQDQQLGDAWPLQFFTDDECGLTNRWMNRVYALRARLFPG